MSSCSLHPLMDNLHMHIITMNHLPLLLHLLLRPPITTISPTFTRKQRECNLVSVVKTFIPHILGPQEMMKIMEKEVLRHAQCCHPLTMIQALMKAWDSNLSWKMTLHRSQLFSVNVALTFHSTDGRPVHCALVFPGPSLLLC